MVAPNEQMILHLEQQLSEVPLEALGDYTLKKTDTGYELKKLSWADRFVRLLMPSRYDKAEEIIQIVQMMKFAFHSESTTLAYAKLNAGLLKLLPQQPKAKTPASIARQKIAELNQRLKKLETEDFTKVLKAIEDLPEKIRSVSSDDEVSLFVQQALTKLVLPQPLQRLRGHENLQKARDEVVRCVHTRLLKSPTSFHLQEAHRILQAIERFDANFGTNQASKVDAIKSFPDLLYKIKYRPEEKQLVTLANRFIQKPFEYAKDFQGRVTRYRQEVGEELYSQFHQVPKFRALVGYIKLELMNRFKESSFSERVKLSVKNLQPTGARESITLPESSTELVKKWAKLFPNYYSAIKTFQREKLDAIVVNGEPLGPKVEADDGPQKVALLAVALVQIAQEKLPNVAKEKIEKIVAEAICVACGDLNPLSKCSFLIEGLNELQLPGSEGERLQLQHLPIYLQPSERVQFSFENDGTCRVMIAKNYLKVSQTGEKVPVQIVSRLEKSLHHPRDDWKGSIQMSPENPLP